MHLHVADKTSIVSVDKTSVASADKTSVVSQDIPSSLPTQRRPPLRSQCLGDVLGDHRCLVCRHNRCLVCRHINFWKTHNLVLPDLAPQKWKSVTIWTYREISQRKSQEWHSLEEAEAGVVVPGLGAVSYTHLTLPTNREV